MHTPDSSSPNDSMRMSESHVDDLIKDIHHQHAPPFDLIACEILDSILQHATTEQIAQFSQIHVDTVRRVFQMIESTLDSPSHSQIIDNCQFRQWSTTIRTNKLNESHTFE